MQSANVKTELVDWKVLNGQSDHGKSDELMRHVASLFSLTASHCDDEQLETYDTVFLRLAELVCEDTRTFAAQKICQLENAPHNIIRKFAYDTITVADPVLRHSPVLTDHDLIDVSKKRGNDHMVSICMRKSISSVVVDVLIKSGHSAVMLKLAANSGAEISVSGKRVLEQAAANDAGLARELANRKQEVAATSSSMKINRSSHPQSVDLRTVWVQLEPRVEERFYNLSRHSYLSRYRFDQSLTKIEKLDEQGFLGNGVLRQFACNDQFADLVCGIARLTGFPHQIIARMMACLEWDQILCIFRLQRFSEELVRDVLECGPWMLCLSANQSNAVLKHYRQMSDEAALDIVNGWAETGLLLE
nr:DUF2336 domain-containing protein [uncultured Cohaesibacter sp.]